MIPRARKPVPAMTFMLLPCLFLVFACGGAEVASVESGDNVEHDEASVAIAVAPVDETRPPDTPPVSAKTEPDPDLKTVRFDLYVMSKCPFAVKVIGAMLPVLRGLEGRADFGMHHIGRDNGGLLTSMHGKEEVAGDIQQLCARELGTDDQFYDFLECQLEDWRRIPDNWEGCVERSGLPFGEFSECAGGPLGEELLRKSFEKSAEARATGSPTVFIDGEPYKGGRSSKSFGRAICAHLREEKVNYCSDLPAPESIKVKVVSDKRCDDRSCDPKRFMAFVTHTFEGAEIEEIDYSEEEGRALFERSGQEFLPIAVFGMEVDKETEGYERIKRRLVRVEKMFGGDDGMVYPLGRKWNPAEEICDDGVDNTGNRKVDCADKTCKGKMVCRKERPGDLKLYVMSECPYAVRVLNVMPEVMERLSGMKRPGPRLTVEYIGNVTDGGLTSMHGEHEVLEDKRQVCAQKLYPRNHKWLDYVACRADQFASSRSSFKNSWKQCAVAGISARAIQKCAEGRQGEDLLRASFERSQTLGITGSPDWLLNNRYEMKGRNVDDIVAAFCERNKCPASVVDTPKGDGKASNEEENSKKDPSCR